MVNITDVKVRLVGNEGGKLKGSDRITNYKIVETRIEGETCMYFSALVNADHVDGFTITGKATCGAAQSTASSKSTTPRLSTSPPENSTSATSSSAARPTSGPTAKSSWAASSTSSSSRPKSSTTINTTPRQPSRHTFWPIPPPLQHQIKK